MTNAYADLSTLKSAGVLNISGTGYDTRLRELLEAVSRLIDRYCNRHFWVLDATRKFDGDGTGSLLVPDLLTVTSLKTDDDKDRTFETTWDRVDYLLYPSNAEPTEPWGRPYVRVLVDSEAGSKDVFTSGRQTVADRGQVGFSGLDLGQRGRHRPGSPGLPFRHNPHGHRRLQAGRGEDRPHRWRAALRHIRFRRRGRRPARGQRDRRRGPRRRQRHKRLPVSRGGGRGLPASDAPLLES